MEFSQYLAAIRRRWPYLVASVVIICGVVLYNVKTSPPVPVYSATSRIFVAANVSSVTADDVAQMAVSSSVAGETIQDLRLPLSVMDIMRRVSADTVSQGPTSRSNVVTVTALATTANEAMRIANHVADLAKDRAIGLTQLGTFHASEQISTQLRSAEVRLKKAQDQVRDFKERHTDLIIPLDFNAAQRAVNSLEDEARNAQASIDDNESRIQVLRRTLGRRTAAQAAEASAPSSAVIDRLQEELASQEIALANERLRYTDKYPKVQQTLALIDNLKQRLNAELRKSFSFQNAPSSLEYQFLAGDMSRFEAERMAATARAKAIDGVMDQAKRQLGLVPDLEVEYARLNTEYTAAQQNYMGLRSKFDDSQLSLRIAKKQLEDKEGIGLVDYAQGADETPGYRFQKPKVKMAISFFVALIVGMGIILFLEGMDTSIRDVDQMEDRYQLPVLGVIPLLRESALKSGSTLVLRDTPNSPFSEPYRIMRANFLSLAAQTEARSVVITSTLPGEGKTTTAANFAASLAESHKRVVLIDADMRNPSLHRAFGTRKEPGLSNYLSGAASLEDVIFPTEVENLLLISGGTIPDNPSHLLTSSRMRELLDELSKRADYVIVDTPPAVAFSDAMELGAITDSMIVVVGAGSKLESAHFRARAHLANVHAVLIGTVLNSVQPGEVDSYRYFTRYYPKLPGRERTTPGKEPAALPEGKS